MLCMREGRRGAKMWVRRGWAGGGGPWGCAVGRAGLRTPSRSPTAPPRSCGPHHDGVSRHTRGAWRSHPSRPARLVWMAGTAHGTRAADLGRRRCGSGPVDVAFGAGVHAHQSLRCRVHQGAHCTATAACHWERGTQHGLFTPSPWFRAERQGLTMRNQRRHVQQGIGTAAALTCHVVRDVLGFHVPVRSKHFACHCNYAASANGIVSTAGRSRKGRVRGRGEERGGGAHGATPTSPSLASCQLWVSRMLRDFRSPAPPDRTPSAIVQRGLLFTCSPAEDDKSQHRWTVLRSRRQPCLFVLGGMCLFRCPA